MNKIAYELHLGDCLDVMRGIPDGSVDAVVTDPPYGIKRFEKGFGYTRFKGYGAEKDGIKWDTKPSNELIDAVLSIGKNHIIWGANNFTLPTSESFLVWDKQQTVPNFASAELAYSDINGLTAKVFRYSIHKHNHVEKFHPTQKPVELMRWCLQFIPDAVTILDPFMGSGTTGVACMMEGRKFIGIEIDPDYYAIAEKRIYEASLQPRLIP